MFKKVSEFSSIRRFGVDGERLFCLTKSGEAVFPSGEKKSLYDIQSGGLCSLLAPYVIYQDDLGAVDIFSSESGELLFSCHDKNEQYYLASYFSLTNDGQIHFTRMQAGSCDTALLNPDTGLKQTVGFEPWSFESGCPYALDMDEVKTEFGRTETLVAKANDGKVIWRYSPEGFFKDNSGTQVADSLNLVVGCYQETLWLHLSSGKLVGIDVNDGSILHSLGWEETDTSGYTAFPVEREFFVPGEYFSIDKENQLIIGYSHTFMTFIDLNEDKLVRRYKTVDNAEVRAVGRGNGGVFDSDFIYFCNSIDGELGVYSRQLNEVVWKHSLPGKIEGMQFSRDKWYVHCSDGKLHIYEKLDT
ncbi:PQQ-like beta-propeller repeat protein [Pleionea sp. CnH1-48]|uniref:PQQ-like beta-propeller repeat protein n=1 Tax=Pleionea sp. CnH1-48 TaxID=2954494 RepID=UPI00209767B4|nr:PQQ-like beta-propeller repeat protein [Pleionea sp. CnH1-48]MCO7223828.1 PQQ-like beta-propeller repeat protein [Pleionea sp. CnH1-48]